MAVEPLSDDAAHLLVVDDDTRIRDLLNRYLKEQGFRVTAACDAKEARRKLAGLEFDLLVVDVMMPGESGVSLTKALREIRDVPILMLTALTEVDNRLEGLEAGADDYLAKPFDPRELVLKSTISSSAADRRTFPRSSRSCSDPTHSAFPSGS